jgi:putative transposase
MRKFPLIEDNIYHIFSKSIANFKVFRTKKEFIRIKDMLIYYKRELLPLRFSVFQNIKDKEEFYKRHFTNTKQIVEIVAYCFMPSHLHLILKQLTKNGISIFMNRLLNSYSRYFNMRSKRKGPLWESRFQNVIIETDEQLLHLTRYIHLNPVTAYLVDRPQDWEFSSYKEYLGISADKICNFSQFLDVRPKVYEKFVNSRIDYQRELAELKKLFLE